jgi:hypothetical protein
VLSGSPPAPKTQAVFREKPIHIREDEMIANALLFTIVILLAYGFWLLDQLKFMARYKAALFHAYGDTVLIFAAVLALNLFGLTLALGRRFFLKNTGRKLSHLDRQFNVGQVDMPMPANEEEGK